MIVTNNPISITKKFKIINNDEKTLTLDFLRDKNQIFDLKLPPSISIMPKETDKNNTMVVPVNVNLRKLGKF